MILLDNTSSILQVVTGGTQVVHVHADWIDLSGTTVNPAVPPQNTIISTATTTTVVGSPAATFSRNIKFVSIRNTDATNPVTITVQHYDGTNTVTLISLSLLAGYELTNDDRNGWRLFTSSGFNGTVITDGVNGLAGVAPSNTAAAAAQPALVTTLSPNSAPQPNTTVTQTLSSVTSGTVMSTAGMTSFGIVFEATLAGTVATISVQQSQDNTATWQGTRLQLIPSGLTVTGTISWSGATAILFYGIAVNPGVTNLRVNMTANTGGSVTYTLSGSSVQVPFLLEAVSAPGSAAPTNALQVGGTDGTDIRALLMDTSGRVEVVGAAATGTAAAGNPLLTGGVGPGGSIEPLPLTNFGASVIVSGAFAAGAAPSGGAAQPVIMGGTDGTDVRTILTDSSGRVIGEITDGTNGIVGVAPASTAPVATQPALVVALSPNTQLYNDSSPATQNITAQDTNTTSTSVSNGQVFLTGTPTANSAATFTLASQETVTVQVTGSWTGTLQAESSMDGGTTYTVLPLLQGTYQVSTWSQNFKASGPVGSVTQFRVRATAAWTGTATVKIITSLNVFAPPPSNISFSASLGALNATVPANGGMSTAGLQSFGIQSETGTLNGTVIFEGSYDGGTTWQACSGGNPNTGATFTTINTTGGSLARAFVPQQGMTLVRLRCSAYTSGSSTWWIAGSSTLGNALNFAMAGQGNAAPSAILQVGGSDGTDLRSFLTDTSGRPNVVGAAASGASPAGNPVLVAGQSTINGFVETISVDNAGNPTIVGAGPAGSLPQDSGYPVMVAGQDLNSLVQTLTVAAGPSGAFEAATNDYRTRSRIEDLLHQVQALLDLLTNGTLMVQGGVGATAAPIATIGAAAFSASGPLQQTVGTTASLVLAANPNRKELIVANTGTTRIYLGFGLNPTSTAYGVPLAACTSANDGTGGSHVNDFWKGAVYAISSAASGTVVVTEFV